MSSPVNNNFLQLIPAAHRVAILETPAESESFIPALQKARRSSSTTSTESNAAEEPTVPVADKAAVAASPVDDAKVTEFLKLGH
ncbi:hypothetical protein PV08_03618 [Exophiala spinifera]|uniref:Uncharacterized protein n=1 Tax=Exophiala spinifera TaxID=91928 RepID=A0A0D2C6W9_9EURO|nr:uncharacterized protein PV08_03618 [Exophiala spinifera]KIW19324.1 hypothetical protein PV08_03618 [Exophiala spinifera]